jgi:hypothetical protein
VAGVTGSQREPPYAKQVDAPPVGSTDRRSTMAAAVQHTTTTALADLSNLVSARQSIAATVGSLAAFVAQVANLFGLFISAVQLGSVVESAALREQLDRAAAWQGGLASRHDLP